MVAIELRVATARDVDPEVEVVGGFDKEDENVNLLPCYLLNFVSLPEKVDNLL